MQRQATILCAVIILAGSAAGQTAQAQSALASLIDAERSFARTALEIGARPAFMKYFADDAVVFRPHPVRYKEATKNVPLPAHPLETTLAWEPLFADVSASGDLGYTTGPSVWTDHTAAKRPNSYAFYFSVWKRQATGEWKVVFDAGTEQPEPYSGPRTVQSPAPVQQSATTQSLSPEEQVVSLMNAEQDFLATAQKEGGLQALLHYAGADVRVYREKSAPLVGGESLRAYFASRIYLSLWQPIFCDVAQAGDLGYVYGSCQIDKPGDLGAVEEKGYYLRVWKRDATQEWKIVSEVVSPLPPEPPKPKQ